MDPIGVGYKLPTHYKGREFSDGRLYKQAGKAEFMDVAASIAKRNFLKIPYIC